MPMGKLTKRVVDSLPLPAQGGDTFAWCREVRGFGVRVKHSGLKTFIIVYKTKRGQFRRHKLGAYPNITVEQARELAKEAFARVSRGEDPSAQRKQLKKFVSVGEMADIYRKASEAGMVFYKGQPLSPTTIRRNEGRFERHIKRLLGKKPLTDVTKADVVKMYDDVCLGKTKLVVKTSKNVAIVTGGRGTARKAVMLLSSLYSFAIKKGYCTENPCLGVEVIPDGCRDRWLNPDEYARLGSALRNAREFGVSSVAANYVWGIALTGARRSELQHLKRSGIDISAPGLRTRMKGHGDKLVLRPCGEIPLQFLQSIADGDNDSWVFPSNFCLGAFVGVDEAIRALTEAAGLKGVTCHTLRHSFATVAGELEYSELTVGGLLGHTRKTVTGKYVHKVETALSAAADQVSAVIAERMGFDGGFVRKEGIKRPPKKLRPQNSLLAAEYG